MNEIKTIENILNSTIAERCSEIADIIYNNKDEVKEKLKKIKTMDKNKNDYWNLKADIQNIVEKEIYRYAFDDGIKFLKSYACYNTVKQAL